MNEEYLQLFLDVINLGSFKKVAEKNYVDQRVVSRQIKRLEAQLNTQLFTRDKNKIKLTPAGEFFRHRSQTILNMMNDTQHALLRFSHQSSNQLSMGYFSPFESQLIRQLMADLSISDNLYITEECIETCLADVVKKNLDCAIIFDSQFTDNHYASLGLDTTTLLKDNVTIGIKKGIVDSNKISTALLQTLPIAYCSIETSSYLHQAILNGLKYDFHPLKIMRVATYEHLQTMVSSGKAIAFYPERLSRKLRALDPDIDYLKPDTNSDTAINFQLVYRQDNKKELLKRIDEYFQDYIPKI